MFPIESGKIAFLHASMVVPYYNKLFRTRTDRYNGILMSLLLPVTEAIILAVASDRIAGALIGLGLSKLWELIYPKISTKFCVLVFFMNSILIKF